MKSIVFPELPKGREYMCIGPHVWQRDADAKKAITGCKKRFGSGHGWKFILYDVPAGSKLDEMGNSIYWDKPADGSPVAPTREILKYDPKSKR